MGELINFVKQYFSNIQVDTVNARELHELLDCKRDFSSWIKGRIEKYKFEEGVDYILVFTNSGENLQGGRPSKDYYLTIDMAKELSMVENNDKGRQARRYFIDCEKKVKSLDTNISLTEQINEISRKIDQIKIAGSQWGYVGASVKKAKKKAKTEFNRLVDEAQLKLDFQFTEETNTCH